MNTRIITTIFITIVLSSSVCAFDSGSTGADGALLPSVDTRLDLPADGIFNFTEVNIPAGVTLTFNSNATNTPVIMLVSGNATIDGMIDVSGGDAAPSNGAGNGNVGDDGQPGVAGPGGFRGGRGGLIDPDDSLLGPRRGQSGVGPGGAPADQARMSLVPSSATCPGIGGSYGGQGIDKCTLSPNNFTPPAIYGSSALLPLIGGSGGSGGAAGSSAVGSGGGGGAGALLIAVSGALQVNGSIQANGGNGGDRGINNISIGAPGGGGSGGAIRLIASTLSGDGIVNAIGGVGGDDGDGFFGGQSDGGSGGVGRIRLEGDTITRTANTNPPFTSSTPGNIFVTGMPVLRIASVAGQPAPAVPSGSADIVLPIDEPNPVSIGLEASNVPLGNTITVTLTPPFGEPVAVVSNALDGTEVNSTATASVDLPEGPSILLARLTFTIAEGQQVAYMQYTDGERIAHIELQADAKGQSRSILVTESGRRVPMPTTEQLVSG